MNKLYVVKRGMASCMIKYMALLLVAVTMLFAPTVANSATQAPEKKEIKGVVVDSKGVAVVGVAVILKGVGTGTATNAAGNFTIQVPSTGNPELTFSCIGMTTTTQAVGNQTFMKVVMSLSAADIGEVIVTGMEVIKKDQMTGSASVLTANDMKMQGITSLDRILEGKIAGLNSTIVTGAPGARTKISIRGENNLSGNTEPLWIVDGLPMLSGVPKSNTGDFAGTIMQDGVGNIMPEDIESITILKDAAASAVYGAKAANGVIVITTKKGFRSKTMINYSGSYEVATAPRTNMGFMNSAEKLRYEKSLVDFFGIEYSDLAGRGGYLLQRSYDGYMSNAEFQKQWSDLENTNTDWYKTIFRNSQSHSHNVTISGGTETMTYYTSISLQQKNGILRANQNTNAGALFKLDYRPIKNLILELNVQANTRKNKDHASAIDPFNYAVFANPYEKPYNADGSYASDHSYLPRNYTAETVSGYKYDSFNILREMNENRIQDNALDANITFRLKYTFLPGFDFESVMRKGESYTTSMREVGPKTYTSFATEDFAKAAYPESDFYPSQYNNGSLNETSGRSSDWSMRNQLNYSFNIHQDHLFSVFVAQEITSKKTNNFGYTSPIYIPEYRITGVPTFENKPSYEQMRNAIGNMFSTSDLQARTVSFIGSARYSYKDRYVVDFSIRADGADIIGDANRYTPLWSVGGRYNLHNETWFENDVVTTLALKASYGYTGNIDRTARPFSTITFGSDSYLGDRYISGFTYPNPSVSWENKSNINAGIDLGLYNGRLNFSADYYFNRTTDILEDLEIPSSTGRTSVRANGGIVENSGIELYVNVKWIDQKDWTFSTSANMARNKNVIVKSRYNYKSYKESIRSSATPGGVINIVGQETGSIYGWKDAGVNPITGADRYYLSAEGKMEFAKILDKWETYTPTMQALYLKATGVPFGTIPDAIDYYKWDAVNDLANLFMPSMEYLGRTNPLIVGGFNTTLRYKNIEFSTSWTFKTGYIIPSFNDLNNAPNNLKDDGQRRDGYTGDLSVSSTNRQKKYLNFWKSEGDITNVHKFGSGGQDEWSALVSSSKYENGNYLRMSNLSLSYRFPTELTEKWGMNNVSLGFSARNLITFTKYKGIDVGTASAFSYPAAKEFNFRLSIGF